MSYRVVINSNPMAALFEALNDNYIGGAQRDEREEDSYLDPNTPTYYINRPDSLPPGAKRPYSMVVVGALPFHLSQFLVSISNNYLYLLHVFHLTFLQRVMWGVVGLP